MPDPTRSFPEGFWWGCATSSHQVEGQCNNDWTQWESRPGKIADGTQSGDAAGWWGGRAESDLDQAVAWGHNAVRISVEWSRLEPEPGRFDDDAFARYAQILDHARAGGLATLVTLNHFTLPRWVAKRGSWSNPAIARWLGGFAARCGEALGTRVDRWATLNEPSLVALFGYAETRWPPGRGSVAAFGPALLHMLEAHAEMARALHEGGATNVGLVLNIPWFRAASRAPWDRAWVAAQDWTVTGVVLEALRTGRAPPPLSPFREVHGLRGSCDWLGLNYYGRFDVRFDPRVPHQAFSRFVQPGSVRTRDTDWGAPDPRGLHRGLERLAALGVPVLVTENGVFGRGQHHDDPHRAHYLRSHVCAVHDALQAGIDVRGYFHWSLVDNFEWAEGWATRFGLLALDRETGARTPRASARVFSQICKNNGLGPEHIG